MCSTIRVNLFQSSEMFDEFNTVEEDVAHGDVETAAAVVEEVPWHQVNESQFAQEARMETMASSSHYMKLFLQWLIAWIVNESIQFLQVGL